MHAQCLLPGDVERIAKHAAPVVVCPGTIEYFKRPAPALAELVAAGVCVAIGTDSKASNPELDLWLDLRRLRRLAPSLTPSQALRCATSAGADALGLSAGRIRPGLPFDALLFEEAPEVRGDELADWLIGASAAPRVLEAGRATNRALG